MAERRRRRSRAKRSASDFEQPETKAVGLRKAANRL